MLPSQVMLGQLTQSEMNPPHVSFKASLINYSHLVGPYLQF